MKFFSVFAAIVAVAFASPAEWTVSELSAAVQDPNTPVALRPILEDALNQLMVETFSGGAQTTTTVSTAVQDFSMWTLHELSEALQDPATDPELAVYLEHALNSMMADIMAGHQPEFVIVGTPVGVLPVVVAPAPVESVVAPALVDSAVAPSSPLVQIIINVKSQQEAAPVAPAPVVPDVILPQPVVLPPPTLPEVVLPQPVVLPPPTLPEVVLPQPVVLPPPTLPEVVIPAPVVLPEPVFPGVNPIDIIAVNPDIVPQPVVMPAPVAPEVQIPVNPVDIIAVNPVQGAVVGPLL